MALGPVQQQPNARTQEPSTSAAQSLNDAKSATKPGSDDTAQPAVARDTDLQQGARQLNQGLEQGVIQEVRRTRPCGRGRCASYEPKRGLGGDNGPPETMLA